jgi:signal transduction histidine kinase
MKLKFKKRLYFIFIASQIILVIVLVYSSKISFDKLKMNLLERRIDSFKNSFSYEIEYHERELSIIAESLKYNYEFLKYYNDIVTNKPVDSSLFYEKMNLKYQVNIIEIGDKEGNVLYRFHRPNDRGDNKLSQIIIKNAIKGLASSSIEYGHSGLALRYATPFLNGYTIQIGKKLNNSLLKSLQRGEIHSIILAENEKYLESTDVNLFNEIRYLLPKLKPSEGVPNTFIYSIQSNNFNHNGNEFLCLVLNYTIKFNSSNSILTFYILYDDTQITNKQNKLISDIVIVSLVVMIFSIIISYIQVSNEAMKLESTESYLEKVQSKLKEAEKIGALGNLVAGFAHKINSPLSAIIAGISNVELNYNDLHKIILESLQKLEEEHIILLKKELDDNRSYTHILSRKAEREKKVELINYINLNFPDHFNTIPGIEDTLIITGITEEDKIKELLTKIKPTNLTIFLKVLDYFIRINKNIKNIERAAFNTRDFINSLKFFSERDLYGNKTNINILDIFNDVVKNYKSHLESRISLILDIEPNSIISCYPLDIKRVFHELIQNSIQAIPSKGGIIISCKINGSEVQILFKDNGIGVPQEIKAKLFEPFISSKKSGEGIGLGLYISKKIIEIHNGSIVHYNQESLTVFQITLPI